MAFSEKISLIVDVVTGNANSQLSSFKSKLGEAEGGFAKLKVGASSAFSTIASSPAAVLAVGTAIAGFAAKGVADFQSVALAAGKFADATGLTVEEASKWLEVADHIGVSGQAVESAFRRMDVAIGTNSAGWKALGVEVVRNQDGTTNLTETFLRAVSALQAIEDPAKRAAAAQKLFGKGYAEVAELIGRSAPELKKMLEEVGDAKIINEDELAKARDFRGAMDDFGDASQEAGMKIGQALVPVLTDLAEVAAKVIDGASKVGEKTTGPGGWGPFISLPNLIKKSWEGLTTGKAPWDLASESASKAAAPLDALVQTVGQMGQAVGPASTALHDLARGTDDAGGAAVDAVQAQKDLAAAIKESEQAAKDAATAIEDMADAARASSDSTFALSEAQDKLTEFVNGYDQAVADAGGDQLKLNEIYRDGAKAALEVADSQVQVAEDTAKASGATLSGAQKIETFNKSALAQAAQLKGPTQAALIDHLAQINKIPPEKVSEIKAKINAGDVAGAEAALNNASRTRNAALITQVLGVSAAEAALQSLTRTRNAIINAQIVTKGGAGFNTTGTLHFAKGGEVPGPKGKPQMAVVHGGEQVISNEDQDKMAARPGWSSWGNPGANITINLPVGSDPAAVRRALDRYALRNGSR